MKEQIKEIIKTGYNLKLISVEMDIPIEQLEQWKRELEVKEKQPEKVSANANGTVTISSQKSNPTVKPVKESVTQLPVNTPKEKTKTEPIIPIVPHNNSDSKMQYVIKRYKELFYTDSENQPQSNMDIILSSKELQRLQQSIALIEEKLKKAKVASKSELKEIAIEILKETIKIEPYFYLPFEEATQLNDLMNSDEMEKMIIMWNPNRKETVSGQLKSAQRKIAVRFARAITNEQMQTEDIEILEGLERRLTFKLRQLSPVEVDAARSSIQSKIQRLRTKNAMDRIRNNIPTNISQIITSLANGQLDIKQASEIIAQEAKRRVQIRPKTNSKFAITEQQEVKQIIIQIQTAMREKAETYPIKNPEATIALLQQLCGEGQGTALRTVVDNLISRKHFETAKRICRKFSKEDQGSHIMIYINGLQEDIKNAEFREFVLTGINSKGVAKQNEYFDLIETGIKRGDIRPTAIILGKSQDGSRNITLADIWPGYGKKETSRG